MKPLPNRAPSKPLPPNAPCSPKALHALTVNGPSANGKHWLQNHGTFWQRDEADHIFRHGTGGL